MAGMSEDEKQLVQLLADMMEEEALPIANRMLLEEKKDPMRV
ncbi:MAG: methionine synthase, partial [Gammaproteobacteria bacterium]|nr:methionine synthase [Gammaproteobacteria bacterium]MCC7464109.1 methionine synthase [Gammaproteobacteria bacterium]